MTSVAGRRDRNLRASACIATRNIPLSPSPAVVASAMPPPPSRGKLGAALRRGFASRSFGVQRLTRRVDLSFRMLKPLSTALSLCVVLAAGPAAAQGQRGAGSRPDAIPSIGERTSGMKKIDGFFPMYWDEAGGRLFVEIPKLDAEVL